MQSPEAIRPLILYVEDDPTMALLLAHNHEKSGFSPNGVEDGHEALSAIEQVRPQLVILDWAIPKLSGLQMLKWIRSTAIFEHIPVVMVTGRGEREDRQIALNHGATAFFRKPFTQSGLTETVRRHTKATGHVEGVTS